MLILGVLLPLVLGILQVAVVAHTRATLTAAAVEGARYGAVAGRGPDDAVRWTRQRLDGVLARRFVDQVTAARVSRDGAVMIEVRAEATARALGPWAPGLRVSTVGHAIVEDRLP